MIVFDTNACAPLTLLVAVVIRFGIGHTLDAVFDAPPLVKQAVTDVCSLNRTYIMEQHDTNIIKYLLDNTPIHSLYTPERYIERIDSQWGGKAAATDQTQEINTRLTVLGGQSGANADAVSCLQCATQDLRWFENSLS